MKLRSRSGDTDGAFDGLTAEDIRRIRGGAAASVTPGMEGLAEPLMTDPFSKVLEPISAKREQPKRKRGRRA